MKNRSDSRPSVPSRKVWLAVAGVVVLAGAAIGLTGTFQGSDETASAAFYAVEEGPLTISVTESGTTKNREQVVIKCEVEGRTAILTLAEEGSLVQPGDLLVELDSSRLVEQKDGQQITVINTEAAFVRAREDLAVAQSQATSDIARAELDLKFAELDLQKYVEGDHPRAVQQAEADITIAREEVLRAKEKLEWSRRLHEQRYLSLADLQADELALKKAELALALAEGAKLVLDEYSHQRDLESRRSDVEQAKMALDRVRRKAAADLVQAEAQLKARESEHQRQKSQLEKIEQQIEKCRIVAPVAGMVVYATTGRGGWRGGDEPLEEGQEVRERQELIYLPTASSMMAEIKIHETSLQKVKVGMPVRVTVDAARGQVFGGRVVRIAPLPDAQSVWLNPDLKVYNSEVHLDGDASDLRPGMSCRAEIFVETYPKALYVPVQCVVREGGKPTVYVRTRGGTQPRVVELGLDNDRMIRILDGLAPGDQVLLAPPLRPTAGTERQPAEMTPETTPAPPASAPEEKPAAQPAEGGAMDWRNLSPEERRKRFENLSPEERQKMMERFRQRQPQGGGQGPGER